MRRPTKSLERKPETIGAPTTPSRVRAAVCFVLLVFGCLSASVAQQKKRDAQPTASPALVTGEQAAQLEAVITTDLWSSFEFPRPSSQARSQFVKLARAGSYDGQPSR